jgi:hypothetical protein
LAAFRGAPKRHQQYAARALTMFYMLDHGEVMVSRLQFWLQTTPIFVRIHESLSGSQGNRADFAASVVDRLLADAALKRRGGFIAPVRL